MVFCFRSSGFLVLDFEFRVSVSKFQTRWWNIYRYSVWNLVIGYWSLVLFAVGTCAGKVVFLH